MFNRNFQEFIELLEKNGVRYLVIGGYAVGFHGFPRYTGDLDVLVAISDQNAERILRVLAEFGFSDLELKPSDFLEEEIVIEIGREPMKIQILTGIDGVTFDECYAGRKYLESGVVKVPFIGLDALLKNKEASPRAKDRIDLEELRRIRKKSDPDTD